MEVGGSGNGVDHGVGGAAVVAEDLPALHAGESVFDAGSDGVEFLLPGGEFAAVCGFAVGPDHLRVTAVDGGVVAVAGLRISGGDDQASVGIDRDLNVGRVPIVLRRRRRPVIPVGTRVPSTIATESIRRVRTGASASNGPTS